MEIRIHNGSSMDLDDVKVGQVHYGAIKAGETTQYQAWRRAFRIAHASLITGGKVFDTGWVCLQTEKPLPTGRYTYIIDLKKSDVSIALEADQREADKMPLLPPANATPPAGAPVMPPSGTAGR